MNLLKKIYGTLLLFTVSFLTAQTVNINGSCVVATGSLELGADSTLITLNGKPVYYNAGLNVNYSGSATSTETYLYYALSSELGTPENRWVISYDGQPFYYFISDDATAPMGVYQPFDTAAPTSLCGGPVTLSPFCIEPNAFAVTGGGAYCAGGSGIAVGLADSEIGVSYQLSLNGSPLGSAVSGTDAAISFGNQTNEGTYTIVGTRIVGGCSTVMSGSVAVSINAVPTVNAGSALSAICQGGTTAALGGSFGGGATGAIWSDGGAGGTFANNDGTAPALTTYTAATGAPSSVTLTLTSTGGFCLTATASQTVSINTGTLYFVDADGDGYNNGAPRVLSCTVLPGYVLTTIGTDCNDNLAAVNPNASEILGNGIDDNCDGTIDEVTPSSSLIASSCGVTLTSLSNTLFAYPLSNFLTQTGAIQGYRFRVTNGAQVRVFESATNSFALTGLPGGATYATTYSIEVSVKHGGYYRAYGAACSVTTPTSPSPTVISNPVCGATLTDIANTIFCAQVPSASGYRFRVRNGANILGSVDTSVNRFSLTSMAGIQFGTTYTVDVLLAFGGVFRPDSEYGPACSITTPATPGTSRVIQPICGSSISDFWTTIFAQQVSGAQGYKFVVTNGAQTREYASPVPRFSLRNLAGGAAPNTSYTIRVDVLYNSVYVQGTVLCTINTTPGASRQMVSAIDIYDVSVYPNPFADTFKLNINTSSENPIGVKVYDMLGRVMELSQDNVEAITNLRIGTAFPSGVYNIVVTQGENVKTIRVVKR